MHAAFHLSISDFITIHEYRIFLKYKNKLFIQLLINFQYIESYFKFHEEAYNIFKK